MVRQAHHDRHTELVEVKNRNMNINRNNYEEYFISYMENMLNENERKSVEQFIASNPDLKSELELFESTKLEADDRIVFKGKEELIKKEEAKIIAWKWNLNMWSIAAMLILAVGTGWWMMNQSAVNDNQFSVKSEMPKLDCLTNSKPEIQNQKEETQFPEKKSIVKLNSSKKIESIIIHETKNCVAQEIYPIESQIKIMDTANKQQIALVDSTMHSKPNLQITEVEKLEPALVEALPIEKEEKILAQVPLKTNSTQRQILKALAWLGGKISGREITDGNFNIDLGFTEISHKEALAKN